jgi:shikimate dehydrogenase
MIDYRPFMEKNLALMPFVSGTTDVYLTLGDPVEQVRAPESFNLIFARLGIDAVLVPAHVAPEHLEAFVRAAFLTKNIKGMWVAIPHKAPITGLLDTCSELGRIAGAVNGIRLTSDGRIDGGLFDGEGFVASLDWFNIAYAAKRALIIGAGGGASAIGASLACGGLASCSEVALFDPVPGKADEVAARIAESTECKAEVNAVTSNDPAGYDLVINASPLGMKTSDPMPCDVARMEPHAALVDILMKNQPTPVVRAARARGLVAQPGFEMMIQQVPLYLEFFGFHEAAVMLRRDATLIRELIYPAELATEIKRPQVKAAAAPSLIQ